MVEEEGMVLDMQSRKREWCSAWSQVINSVCPPFYLEWNLRELIHGIIIHSWHCYERNLLASRLLVIEITTFIPFFTIYTGCDKVATLAFKIRSTGSPAYLLHAVSNYIPTRHLRSSSQLLLSKPGVRTEISRRSFIQAAPSVWNSLPVEIRVSETARQFRSATRTH